MDHLKWKAPHVASMGPDRWKSAYYDPGPDPHSFKAFWTEMQMGARSARDEVGRGAIPAVTLQGVAADEVADAAQEIIASLKRITAIAEQGGVARVRARRFCTGMSSSLSKLMYNLGRVEGYDESSTELLTT